MSSLTKHTVLPYKKLEIYSYLSWVWTVNSWGSKQILFLGTNKSCFLVLSRVWAVNALESKRILFLELVVGLSHATVTPICCCISYLFLCVSWLRFTLTYYLKIVKVFNMGIVSEIFTYILELAKFLYIQRRELSRIIFRLRTKVEQ